MKNTTTVGRQAEQLASKYLSKIGYEIIERNFRNRYCEIDILATNGEYICLIEVKYRKNSIYGGGLEAINYDKQRRLRNAFEYWLSQNSQYANMQPRIDVLSVDSCGELDLIENAV